MITFLTTRFGLKTWEDIFNNTKTIHEYALESNNELDPESIKNIVNKIKDSNVWSKVNN